MVDPIGQQDALLGEVDRQLGVGVGRQHLEERACVVGSTTIGRTPFLRLLLRKMSAYEVYRIARIPMAFSAQGACSRDDPAPKLSPTRRMPRPAIAG